MSIAKLTIREKATRKTPATLELLIVVFPYLLVKKSKNAVRSMTSAKKANTAASEMFIAIFLPVGHLNGLR